MGEGFFSLLKCSFFTCWTLPISLRVVLPFFVTPSLYLFFWYNCLKGHGGMNENTLVTDLAKAVNLNKYQRVKNLKRFSLLCLK